MQEKRKRVAMVAATCTRDEQIEIERSRFFFCAARRRGSVTPSNFGFSFTDAKGADVSLFVKKGRQRYFFSLPAPSQAANKPADRSAYHHHRN